MTQDWTDKRCRLSRVKRKRLKKKKKKKRFLILPPTSFIAIEKNRISADLYFFLTMNAYEKENADSSELKVISSREETKSPPETTDSTQYKGDKEKDKDCSEQNNLLIQFAAICNITFFLMDIVRNTWSWPSSHYVGRVDYANSLTLLQPIAVCIFFMGNIEDRMQRRAKGVWWFAPAIPLSMFVYTATEKYVVVDGGSLGSPESWKPRMWIVSIIFVFTLVTVICFHMWRFYKERSHFRFMLSIGALLGFAGYILTVTLYINNTNGSGVEDLEKTASFLVPDSECQFALFWSEDLLRYSDDNCGSVCDIAKIFEYGVNNTYGHYEPESEREVRFILHHYTWASMSAMFFNLKDSRISALAQATCIGIAIHGFSFYGAAPWWSYA